MFSYTVNFFPLSILWQLTLTFDPTNDLDLDRVKVNHQGKYLGQRSLRMKVIVRTHRHRQTNRTECSTLTTKVDSRNHVMFCVWLITRSRLTVTVWLLRSNSPSMTSGSHYVSLSENSYIPPHYRAGGNDEGERWWQWLRFNFRQTYRPPPLTCAGYSLVLGGRGYTPTPTLSPVLSCLSVMFTETCEGNVGVLSRTG